MRTWLGRSGLMMLAASACLAAGCASERDPINRVQPNALPKTFFVGQDLKSPNDDPEFRVKSFTVGSSVSQSAYSIGEFSAVDRIRWDITEGMLLARRSHQESPGADNRGTTAGDIASSTDKSASAAATGTIVAAFKIVKHFDVRRDYNATTGEETNVVVENDSDRPWNEHEYVRVDWSQNLVTSTDDGIRFGNGATITPVAYNVTDPSAEDAPHLETENGYLDVTNKFTVDPEDVSFSWGKIKKCQLVSYFTGSSTFDCNPQEATVRTSFARVQPDEDFEKFEDDYAWKDVVGNTGGQGDGANPWLGSARTTWDPQYGFQDGATHRFKSIHNIWKKSHQNATCGGNDDADKNGTADACENAITGYAGHAGSQCDVTEHRCTLPVRDRELRTIAYFLNKEAPDAFQDKVGGDGNGGEGQGHGARNARADGRIVEPAPRRIGRVPSRGRVPPHRRRRSGELPRAVLRQRRLSRAEADGAGRWLAHRQGEAAGRRPGQARLLRLPQPGPRLRPRGDLQQARREIAARRHPEELPRLLALRVARALRRRGMEPARSAERRDLRRHRHRDGPLRDARRRAGARHHPARNR